MNDVISTVIFLVVGYFVLLVLAGCFTTRAKARGRAERQRDHEDRDPVVYHGRKNRKGGRRG